MSTAQLQLQLVAPWWSQKHELYTFCWERIRNVT